MKRFVVTIIAAAVMVSTTSVLSAETRIQQRKENQQRRIGTGVKNGSLTPKETSRLENKEANLNKEIRNDRKVNGGISLTTRSGRSTISRTS